jgi:hypothetical protein
MKKQSTKQICGDNMDENRIKRLRVVLTRNQLMTFVGGLHEMQLQMIDEAVDKKEKEGFPEANEVIGFIQQKTKGNQ